MNSKILQDKIQEIESHEIEMRLLRKNESKPDMNSGDDKEKAGLQSNQPTVSLKHYDQVCLTYPYFTINLLISIKLAALRPTLPWVHYEAPTTNISMLIGSQCLQSLSFITFGMSNLLTRHDRHAIIHVRALIRKIPISM